MNFYNDTDENACEWTRQLISAGLVPDGVVSSIPIQEIKPHELRDFTQAHFFSGICGWPLAFRLAGVSDDENADTGSCPCQPFSGTGKQMGFADPRHLWPAFRRVIVRRQSAKVYGEQVASKLGREWLSRVFSDLAFMGYAGTGADLCSAGVGSPNIRQRLYWMGDATETRFQGGDNRPHEGRKGLRERCGDGGMANPESQRCGEAGNSGGGETEWTGGRCTPLRLGHADHARREGRLIRWDGGHERAAGEAGVAGHAGRTRRYGMWSDADLIFCRDKKWRRIEPGSFPLADGIPSRVGPLLTELRKLGRSSIALARANRNIRLKGYGNAINPHTAALFIRAAESARVGMLGLDAPAPENLDD